MIRTRAHTHTHARTHTHTHTHTHTLRGHKRVIVTSLTLILHIELTTLIPNTVYRVLNAMLNYCNFPKLRLKECVFMVAFTE